MTGLTLADTFATLERAESSEPDGSNDGGVYTALAPVYEAIYATYDRIDGQFETVATATPLDAATVLEVGCGTGALLARLDDAFDRVIGADTSPPMVRRARERAGTDVVVGSVDAFRPRRFDVVAMMGAVLGHVRPDASAKAMLAGTYERLNPGGRFVGSVHDRAALASPDSTARRLTAETPEYRVVQRDRQHPVEGGAFDWEVEYTLTERESGRSVSVERRVPIRAFDPEELIEWLHEAGFRDVETTEREFVDEEQRGRAFVVTASATQ